MPGTRFADQICKTRYAGIVANHHQIAGRCRANFRQYSVGGGVVEPGDIVDLRLVGELLHDDLRGHLGAFGGGTKNAFWDMLPVREPGAHPFCPSFTAQVQRAIVVIKAQIIPA